MHSMAYLEQTPAYTS